jgi:hypothetical protein
LSVAGALLALDIVPLLLSSKHLPCYFSKTRIIGCSSNLPTNYFKLTDAKKKEEKVTLKHGNLSLLHGPALRYRSEVNPRGICGLKSE